MPEAPASTHKRASSPRSTPLTITGSAASAQSHARSSIEAPEYRPLNDASGAGLSQNAGGGGGGAVRPSGIKSTVNTLARAVDSRTIATHTGIAGRQRDTKIPTPHGV